LYPLQHEEEKQLNKLSTIPYVKKTGLITCLFLCSWMGCAQPSDWLKDEPFLSAYTLALNLQVEESRAQLKTIKSPEQIYIASLSDIFELLVTEDEVKFERYENAYEVRLEELEKINPATATSLFVTAELRLQWAFTYLKFGHEFDAAWNIRQAYLLVQECKKRDPDFLPIKKTSGMLEVMLGSVPEKYQWVMSLLNMQGSIEKGMQELEQVRNQSKSLHFETSLLYYLIQGFVLQQTELAMQGMDKDLLVNTDNPLALFMGASLAIKNSQSEKALTLLTRLEQQNKGVPLVYVNYQLGEVYLHKGNYASSIGAYQKFLKSYRGLNYIKDVYYKIGICYWLSGNAPEAKAAFEKAKDEGKESTEADKYAARSLAEDNYPNSKLSKIRYATDGGYYDEAKKIVNNVIDTDLSSTKDEVEFPYRKARLFHKSGEIPNAIKFYKETIFLQGNDHWYFAPNASLQLGYIFQEQKKLPEARQYFEKALSYKKHEYKNSIDSKAKSALAQLKE
jgi:tetratricopeptide (TPR) repeat protein